MTEESILVPKGKPLATVQLVTTTQKEPALFSQKKPGSTLDTPTWSSVDICDPKLSDEQRQRIRKLLLQYNHVFSMSPEDTGRTEFTTHSIDTGDSRPIRVPPRRIPLTKVDEARRY